MSTPAVATPIPGRISFARIGEVMEMPYLLETQMQSYKEFLQFDLPADQREDKGLQEVFRSVFPISPPGDPSSLEFQEYSFGTPKYTVRECLERGMTYSAPLKLKLQLIVREVNEESGQVEIRDIKEQEVYMGEVPLMTEQGTFIINGAERVIVSQLHRSPGVSFSSAPHPNGKLTYSARIIPYRGAWVEFEIDIYGVMHVMIDRKRKIPATTFLRSFSYSDDSRLAAEFFETEQIPLDDFEGGATPVARLGEFLGSEFIETIRDDNGKKIVESGAKVTKKAADALRVAGIERVHLNVAEGYENLIGRILAADVIDHKTGEILAECWETVTTSMLRKCARCAIKRVTVLKLDTEAVSHPILNTINKDKIRSEEDALIEFFRRMRPGNPVSIQAAKRLFEEMFLSEKRYDLGSVGRYKINKRFYNVGTGTGDLSNRLLTTDDIIHVMKHLVKLWKEEVDVDDIDHLGNRRVRCVGELLQNQIRLGLAEIEKTARERMAIVDLENMLPQNLINAKPLVTAVRDFFGRSQLSQFMDQTNPLAELTHKRRLSALGPGGLSRDRAGFEVRDVHHTHYGRVCPIETPEGPNIGLISSLCTFARINPFGFIETPYRQVKDGVVTAKIDYLTADVEDEFTIAQANAPLDEKKRFRTDRVLSRRRGDFPRAEHEDVHYMDISPKQLVSVSAALIPFLEHDDANRALMGSNMQRQAVPLLFTNAPLVGTGVEEKVARDSGVCIIAKRAGRVVRATGDEIVVETPTGSDTYSLRKYQRSNQNTCMNQRPIVHEGDTVAEGAVLADGPATKNGELALGQNVLVAFMSAGGHNFEDAILLSERLVRDDVFTSIHIEEFEIDARDTKLGKEEITRDIPNVSEEALAKLDENGVVQIGAEVKAGDILVGKVTPKGETELSAEEKLLRAIFGEKAGDVRDASLKAPPGTHGIVIDARIYSRKERGQKSERDDRARIAQVHAEKDARLRDLNSEFEESLMHALKKLDREIVNFETGRIEMKAGDKPSKGAVEYIRHSLDTGMLPVDGPVGSEIKRLYQDFRTRKQAIDDHAKNQEDRIKTGDELPPGVIKLVKVYVASKRKVSVGDKMAGRHGNKGVVAKILPIEDMPFLADGTPCDIVLNPLGVPSRMNIGQLLETHLGWAAHDLGKKVARVLSTEGIDAARKALEAIFTPSRELKEELKERGLGAIWEEKKKIQKLDAVELTHYIEGNRKGFRFATEVFDGAEEAEIHELLAKAELNPDGQTVLYDGLTGEPFDQRVTVGIIYMLKLAHLVDDKMHARSIGPYSLVTQQPLGGKAQFGGQRFGEMEVWALEAYGAAFTLQELLTVKSDDVEGRTRIYESIVKGQNSLAPGVPESFNVLVKELQALCLDLELLIEGEEQETEDALAALEGIEDDSFLDDDEFGLDSSEDDDAPSAAAEVSAEDAEDLVFPDSDD
jgi:DNA-directed RNA polymerase subunit beta